MDIKGSMAETTDIKAINKLIDLWEFSEEKVEQIEFHTDKGLMSDFVTSRICEVNQC